MSRRSPMSGFTLLEALIALALLAITAVSFLRATEANVQRVAALEIRTTAALVAQNRLAELTLGMVPADGVVRQMGRDFDVKVVATPSADRSLIQLDVMVNEAGGGAGARLTGFVAQGTEGSI
jgi:general secretion pathway protein I